MRVPPRSVSEEEAPHEPACPEGRGDTAGPLSRESGREAQAEESARESEAAESDAAELLGENAMPAGRLSSRGERAAEDMAPSEGLEAYGDDIRGVLAAIRPQHAEPGSEPSAAASSPVALGPVAPAGDSEKLVAAYGDDIRGALASIRPEAERAAAAVIAAYGEDMRNSLAELRPGAGRAAKTTEPGAEAAAAAQPAAPEKRYDGGHGPFTFEEFEAYYGAEEASRRWQAAAASGKRWTMCA